MKIRMLKTMQAAPNGIAIVTYSEGETYDLPQNLAEIFIRESWGETLKNADRKDFGSAPENKSRRG